jgi:hypothetical protein
MDKWLWHLGLFFSAMLFAGLGGTLGEAITSVFMEILQILYPGKPDYLKSLINSFVILSTITVVMAISTVALVRSIQKVKERGQQNSICQKDDYSI